MADALARRSPAIGEKSPIGTMTAVQYFTFLEEYTEADNRVKTANNQRKELRDRIKAALGDPDLVEAFDRARKGRDLSGAYRQKQDAAYAQLMAFDRKPVGYQARLGVGEDGQPLPMTQAEAARIDLEGLEAGKAKWSREDNPYISGSDEFDRWDTAWRRGQAKLGADLTDDTEKKAATLAVVEGGKRADAETAKGSDPETPKRRGRPPGSGKKAREAEAAAGQQRTPDAGEGGDLGEGQGDQGGEPGEQAPPQGDPPGEGAEQQAGKPDRYGDEWPSRSGQGNTTTH